MIEVTPEATKAMVDYFKGKEKMPVRIFVKMGGCGIRSFGIALEKALPTDELHEIDGISYIMEQRLMKRYGPLSIDSDGFSFRISGNGIYPPMGCGTCGYGCGSRGGSRCSGVCKTCENPCPTGKRILARRKKHQ
jgi:Fe-S cluster assembly iron-binding protein IscA